MNEGKCYVLVCTVKEICWAARLKPRHAQVLSMPLTLDLFLPGHAPDPLIPTLAPPYQKDGIYDQFSHHSTVTSPAVPWKLFFGHQESQLTITTRGRSPPVLPHCPEGVGGGVVLVSGVSIRE